MDLRTLAWRVGASLGLLLAVGCTDPMLGLSDAEASEPTLRLATQPSSRLQGRPSRPDKKPPTQQQADPLAPAGDIYTLYLVRDRSSVPAGPYNRIVPLVRAEPARAVWLMEWLTEPSGQGGSGNRQFLVYADPTVLEWAADIVGMIDVRAAATAPASGPRTTDALAQTMGVLYTVSGPADIGRETAGALLKQLEGYCSSPGDPHRRWAACVLAGKLAGEVLGKRKDAAALYDRAASLALPASPAWLIARYNQARALEMAGNQAEARRIAQDIVQTAGRQFSRVHAYQQARKLAEKGR